MIHPTRSPGLAPALAAALLLLAPVPGRSQTQDLPNQLLGVGIDQKLDGQIPLDLPFVDEAGRPVTIGSYFGETPVVLVLAYYECPMLCTLVLNGLVRAMRAINFDLGDEYRVVTVSIDPGEAPQLAAAKRKEYLKTYDREGTEDGWAFLTGKEADIHKLADAVGFRYKYDPETDQYAHAAAIMVATPEGRLARYFYGVEYPPKDLRLGLMEASERKIGSPVDQVLLFCFHYDPLTGKYGLAIMKVIQIAGVLTVVGIAIFLISALRADRRKKLAAGHAGGAQVRR